MSTGAKKPSPERDQTDESLRTEREKADLALAEAQESVDEDADLVVRRARVQADAVLVSARDRADELLRNGGPAAPSAAIVEERAVEDQALRDERAAADEALHREREQDAIALARLLPLERDRTDRFLLTERERSDDALSVRDDFLGIVSHDLRNLLGGIVMSAGLLSHGATDDDAVGKQLLAGTKRIQRYAARMNRLIGDLVDVASIDAGKLSMTPVDGDAAVLVTEAVDTFQAAASAAGIALSAQDTATSLPARFDHDRLLQVLANLIANAIKFTPSGGAILVHAERHQDGIRFWVGDSGAGIPGTMLESIFERFWQVGKNDRRGMGLGLYISRCIVEAHGGTIWAESREGTGSKLWFTLPAGDGSTG